MAKRQLRIARLEAQIHFLVEQLSEKQLEDFIKYCQHQN
jgi:hypothetical protein